MRLDAQLAVILWLYWAERHNVATRWLGNDYSAETAVDLTIRDVLIAYFVDVCVSKIIKIVSQYMKGRSQQPYVYVCL